MSLKTTHQNDEAGRRKAQKHAQTNQATMCQVNENSSPGAGEEAKKPAWWKLLSFWLVLIVDVGVSVALGIPFQKA